MKLTIDGYPQLIKNKYFKWYKNIIIKRINSPILVGEKHHIVPRSMGGDNSKKNIVKLSSKEHYICHLCLIKFTVKQDYYKMLCAINCMSMKTLKGNFNYNSKLYEFLRDNRVKELKEWLKINSPFKNKLIHKKSIDNRTKNGTNIFVTKNPMHNQTSIKKKVQKTSGKNHYLCKKYRYEYSLDFGKTWISINNELTTKEICDNIFNCSISTFNKVLLGKIAKRGPLSNTLIRKIKNENQKN
jgi:transposase-like protein